MTHTTYEAGDNTYGSTGGNVNINAYNGNVYLYENYIYGPYQR